MVAKIKPVQFQMILHRYVIMEKPKRETLKATVLIESSLYLENGTKLAQIIVNL